MPKNSPSEQQLAIAEKRTNAAQFNETLIYCPPQGERGRMLELMNFTQCLHVITSLKDPESMKRFEAFYGHLCKYFRQGEVEELKTFVDEMELNEQQDPRMRCFTAIAEHPNEEDEIVSGGYSTLQGETAAWRFLLTDDAFRDKYISQEMIQRMQDAMIKAAHADGKEIRYALGECNKVPGPYFEQTLGILRMYTEVKPGVFQEIHYEIPHLGAWDPNTGEPVGAVEPLREHLQARVIPTDAERMANASGVPLPQVTPADLEAMLSEKGGMWTQWYVRSREQFAKGEVGDKAHARHREIVMQETLQKKILEPLKGKQIRQISTVDRIRMEKEGKTFIHHDDDVQ